MRLNFWNKRIPTLLGVLIIVGGIGITTFLVNQGIIFITKASPTNQPENVRITNITEASFTVSYTTQEAVIGSVNYGLTKEFGQTALDERDQQTGNLTDYKIHHITVRNLTPQKKYYFSVLSGGDVFLNNKNAFEVTTGRQITESPQQQEPLAGKVITPDGNAPVESIVYVTSPGSQVVSTITDDEGNYLLPLNSIRTQNLSVYYKYTNESVINLLITGNEMESNVALSINQINPVPTVTLSNNYDFTSGIEPVASVFGQQQRFPSFNQAGSSTTASIKISTPKANQSFNDFQPTFSGTALANQNVAIIVGSIEEISADVKADANGNWSYRPDSTLASGVQTITITTNNSQGSPTTISQNFTINPSGSQVSESATPSGTLTPTETPILTISPTLPIETPTPTIESTNSASITVTETPTPSTSDIPAPGNTTGLAVGIIGIATTLLGLIFFILSRGSIHI